MKFTPKTEAEVSQFQVFPAGIYDFEIVKAEDVVSKAGNEMIKAVLKVYDRDGKYNLVTDYLLSDEAMAFKLCHCCAAIGILPKYEAGELVGGDLVSGTGQVKLKIDKGKPKDDGSGDMYQDKNAVTDYVVPDSRTQEQKKQMDKNHGTSIADKLDDSIPF